MVARSGKTPRDRLDFYPTPAEVAQALHEWLCSEAPGLNSESPFLDPAAGDGALIEGMRSGELSECHWSAIEVDPRHEERLELVAENVEIADAISTEWPAAHVVANPPFRLLDQFWRLAADHRNRFGSWCAVFAPVAWFSAEKRSGFERPDYVLQLGWRPVFRPQSGPAHKGSQDFAWLVLAPARLRRAVWQRLEKP